MATHINASRTKQFAKRVLQLGRLGVHTARDNARFWRYAALSNFDSSYEQLVARIMYNVHALEKGLAQTTTWRPGRGAKAIKNLNDALAVYRRQGYDEDAYAFRQGLAILQRYVEKHADHRDSIKFMDAVVDPAFLNPEDAASRPEAGTKVVRKADKLNNASKSFYELSQGRSSVRFFSGESIDTEAVRRTLRNAEKTPSVCNRQGWKVYWIEDKEVSQQVLRHQRGFGNKQMPEVLLAITVSTSTFISPVERNQAFIDGGLFSMSVLYGLEHEGLAAVPLNACLYIRDRQAIDKLLDVDPAEEIIMFIAIGAHPEESIVPVSDRRPAGTFIRGIDSSRTVTT